MPRCRRRLNYVYEPLEPGSKELRVLQFLPDEDGTINLRLINVGHGSSYHCLSYRWGKENPSQERKILINGMRFLVRPNLWSFLHVARRKYPNYLFWIDAISINQNDDVEKAMVVKRMGQIYAKAAGVVIWLGEGSYYESCLIAYIRNYQPRIRYCNDVERKEKRRTVLRQDQIDQLSLRLCNNEYWTRAWIVQEVAHGTSKVVLQGFKDVSWSNFFKFVKDILHLSSSRAGRVAAAAESFQGAAFGLPLDHLFNMYELGHQECFQTHDRIFALRSVIRGGFAIEVDYQLKLEELFFRVLSSLAPIEGFFRCAHTLLKLLLRELFERLNAAASQRATPFDEIRCDDLNFENKPFFAVWGRQCQGDCRRKVWRNLGLHEEQWNWLGRCHEVCSNCAATEYFADQPWFHEDPQLAGLSSESISVMTLGIPSGELVPGHFLFVRPDDGHVWRCRSFIVESTIFSDSRLLSGITLTHVKRDNEFWLGRAIQTGKISFSRFGFMDIFCMTWDIWNSPYSVSIHDLFSAGYLVYITSH